MDGGLRLGVTGIVQRPSQRRFGIRELSSFRQRRGQAYIGIDIVGLNAKQLAIGIFSFLMLAQFALRLAQSQIGVGNIRGELDDGLKGGHGLFKRIHSHQRGAVKKGKPYFARIERAGPLQQWRGFGMTPLLQPDGSDQRHQLVVYAPGQQRAHDLVGRFVVAGLQVAPGQGDGGIGDRVHGWRGTLGTLVSRLAAGKGIRSLSTTRQTWKITPAIDVRIRPLPGAVLWQPPPF